MNGFLCRKRKKAMTNSLTSESYVRHNIITLKNVTLYSHQSNHRECSPRATLARRIGTGYSSKRVAKRIRSSPLTLASIHPIHDLGFAGDGI
ncbi:hypothetical protein VNO77_17455 [Canavalia gladiata]|uniref:Uncharacterized protein n=1 Tax=Canavalia gladiata TaxID=3824 RepID=A0AAN9QIR9_CANGL